MVALNYLLMYLNGMKSCHPNSCGALGRVGEGTLPCDVDSDYAACPDGFESTSGLDITLRGADHWRVRIQKSTALSMTNAKYYVFGAG